MRQVISFRFVSRLPHSLRLILKSGQRTPYVPLCSPVPRQPTTRVVNLTLYVKILGSVVGVRS